MNSFHSAFDQHAFLFWIVLAALFLLLAVTVLRLHLKMQRLNTHLDDLFGGLTGENTPQMLAEYLTSVRSTAASVSRLKVEHDQIASVMPTVVRHVGLVRFSPFHDTGGDQSFALAVLDGRGDGVVVTGLHSRHDSRLYAKPIEGGSSTYSLTREEREAMERALHREPAEVGS